ncbi:MAG: TonB-dependent receptor plug domain-containing protein [Bacteroidota bacterium]
MNIYKSILIAFSALCLLFPSIIAARIQLTDSTTVSSIDTIQSGKQQKFSKIIPIDLGFALSHSSNKSNKITSDDVLLIDYRSAGDILNKMSFTTLQDLGSFGQPNELMIYGLGYSNISYVRDGVVLNNRWQNSFDLNHLQIESVDSIQINTLAEGFIYGHYNNPASVSITSKRDDVKRPVSHLRFYQAPDEEGLVDISFKTPITGSTFFSFNVTNKSINPRSARKEYNTAFGSWQAEAKINYLISENINLLTSYNYLRSEIQLNGGVVKTIDMFEPRNALVNYSSRFSRTTTHTYNASLLAKIFNVNESKIDFYNINSLFTFKQNRYNLESGVPRIVNNNRYKTLGISVQNKTSLDFATLTLLADYEHLTYDTELVSVDTENYFSTAGVISFSLLDSLFTLSSFVKLINYGAVNYYGAGAQFSFSVTKSISIFAGTSSYGKPLTAMESSTASFSGSTTPQNVKTIETRVRYYNPLFECSLGYFHINNDGMPFSLYTASAADTLINETDSFIQKNITRQGVSFDLDFSIWKINFAGQANYYFNNSDNDLSSLPEYAFKTELFYSNIHFNDNLFVKAGFSFVLSAEKSFIAYDFQRSNAIPLKLGQALKPINTERVPLIKQLDLFLIGRIQNQATIFVIFENILDENFYLIPFYPMPKQGMRLGVSWEFLD